MRKVEEEGEERKEGEKRIGKGEGRKGTEREKEERSGRGKGGGKWRAPTSHLI